MAASIWSPGSSQQVPALPAVAPVSFVKGTVGNPGINFVGDTETGIWSETDGYLNFVCNGITQLRIDPAGNITGNKMITGVELTLASATITDIGAVASNSVQITGTTTINSFGTAYRGPMFVRFASALTLTYNATTLILPGAANISINAGDAIVVTPKATAGTADGWVVVSYTSGSPNLNAVSSLNNGQLAGLRNRIINGDMRIDQRSSGSAYTGSGSQYTLDRWKSSFTGGSVANIQQNLSGITAPVGFPKYLGLQTTSVVTLLATDGYSMLQKIEGANVADLSFGTASASTVTLSFWVRSTLTGTFGGSLRNSVGDRSYVFSYTITAANTWQYKTITIPGDTTGTWLTDNGAGIFVFLSCGVGTAFQTAAGSWLAGNYVSVTGEQRVMATVGATFAFTGVQLEKGNVATPFEQRPYGMELLLCQRYAESVAFMWQGNTTSGGSYGGSFQFAADKRISPSFSTALQVNLNGSFNTATFTAITSANRGAYCIAAATSTTTGGAYVLNSFATAEL
jgi:hypothetical protein